MHWNLFYIMWLSWVGYWWPASFNVKTTARHETLLSRLSHIVPLALATILLWAPNSPMPVLGERFLPDAAWLFWFGAVLTFAGLLFTVWARVHRSQLERHDHRQAGPRLDHQRPVSVRAPSGHWLLETHLNEVVQPIRAFIERTFSS